MHKSVQIAVVLALLSCAVYSQNMWQGMTMWNPQCPDNDASCFMSVWGNIMPNGTGMWLSQSYHSSPSSAASQPPSNCHWWPFNFESWFHGETLNHSMMWMNNTDSNNWVMNATMTSSDLMMMNGTACMAMPQTQWAGMEQYMCKMTYDTIHVYITIWGSWMNGQWMWDTTHGMNAWWPWNMMNNNDQSMQAMWVGTNSSWPWWTAQLCDSCGSNTNVSSLSSNVTVTMPAGTNMTAWLPGCWLAYTMVKPWSSMNMNGSYMSWPAKSNMTLFDNWSNNSCWWMGMTWGDVLPDMNYCANGCEVSFVITNAAGHIFVMETSGCWTMASGWTGNNGTSGSTGSTGTSGSVGTGSTGSSTGVSGSTGSTSTTGTSGSTGTTSTSTTGTSGSTGTTSTSTSTNTTSTGTGSGNGGSTTATVGTGSNGVGITVSSGLSMTINALLLAVAFVCVNLF